MSKKDIREDFRPKLKVNQVAEVMKKNPNKAYALVRFDDDYDPNKTNVEYYESKGWDIVSDTAPIHDDRSISPQNKDEESLRKHPITKRGRGKAEFVLMSIDIETLQKNEADKVKRNQDRYVASSTGRKAVQKGDTLSIIDSEVNESNMNVSSNDK